MLEIRGIWHFHMSRWDRYVLCPRIWMKTSRSGTVSNIGPYKGEPYPYLFSRVLLVNLYFSWFGNSREIRAGAKHASNIGRTLPVVPDAIPLAGTIGSPDFLTFKDNHCSGTSGGTRITPR